MVKSTVEISQNFVAFSEYMNFTCFHPTTKQKNSVAAVITRVSNIGDEAGVGFLKDALTVVENVHRQFAGKLVNFLVHKFLVGPHLSLTRQAQCSNFQKVSRKKISKSTDLYFHLLIGISGYALRCSDQRIWKSKGHST